VCAEGACYVCAAPQAALSAKKRGCAAAGLPRKGRLHNWRAPTGGAP
jgi:hypothetical protein